MNTYRPMRRCEACQNGYFFWKGRKVLRKGGKEKKKLDGANQPNGGGLPLTAETNQYN